MTIGIIGAGAFGTALALTLDRPVLIWGRDGKAMQDMAKSRKTGAHLPGFDLPDHVSPVDDLARMSDCDIVLIAVSAQGLRAFLADHAPGLTQGALVACCKGLDLTTLKGPSATIKQACPHAHPAVLTGPSFAIDIARGLPTALTLACSDADQGLALQRALSTRTLRLYRTEDVTGAEIGGALKNVIAIACGIAVGAGLGASAQAALMTRGFAELRRLALRLGAQESTLMGLSGFGDLVLTCSSDQSRNFRFGSALGAGTPFSENTTVEGRSTLTAALQIGAREGIELPVCAAVSDLVAGRVDVHTAMQELLRRPLKEE